MALNFQDVIRDVHNPQTHTLQTSSNATIFAVVNTASSGQASIVLDNSVSRIGFATVAVTALPTVIADTELPTAAALSDTFANPTSPAVGAMGMHWDSTQWQRSRGGLGDGAGAGGMANVLPMVYNGSTHDRMRGDTTGGLYVQGAIAAGATDSGNPLKVGGRYNSSQPVFTDGQRGDLQLGTRGSLRMELWGSDSNVAINRRADNGDAVAESSGVNNLAVINRNTVYNGTSWDRMKGNVSGLWVQMSGTSRTLIPLPVGLGANSLSTIAVPSSSNKVNVTQLILSSNVTTEIAIKSGVTYLTGNASLGITLYPGGGFVMNGSSDSPAWIGLPSGAMVIEKRDAGGTVSKIGGNLIYFDA